MAIIPPKKMQSIRFHPKAVPTATPNNIIQNIIVQAAIIAAPPTFDYFLKAKLQPQSKQQENNADVRPSLYVCRIHHRRV